MQPILPTSLDMASARVLGFDATAYINDTNSTLNQRLNIPGAFALGDCYASTSKTSNKNKNKNIGTILAGVASIAAGAFLCAAKLKGKFKGKNKKINLDFVPNLAKSVRKTFGSVFKK